jgi:hypothetical protein
MLERGRAGLEDRRGQRAEGSVWGGLGNIEHPASNIHAGLKGWRAEKLLKSYSPSVCLGGLGLDS